jgi:hypothetical protein
MFVAVLVLPEGEALSVAVAITSYWLPAVHVTVLVFADHVA